MLSLADAYRTEIEIAIRKSQWRNGASGLLETALALRSSRPRGFEDLISIRLESASRRLEAFLARTAGRAGNHIARVGNDERPDSRRGLEFDRGTEAMRLSVLETMFRERLSQLLRTVLRRRRGSSA